jgi:hypothetical protein
MSENRPAPRKPVLLGCLGILLGLVVAVTAAGAWMTGYLPVRLFSEARWKDPARRDQRVTMVSALLLIHRLEGRTRGEVVELLGEPTDTDYFADWDLVYWLGDERGLFGIDSEWLVIRLGPDGRVSEHDVLTD